MSRLIIIEQKLKFTNGRVKSELANNVGDEIEKGLWGKECFQNRKIKNFF